MFLQETDFFVGVMDGHGVNGAKASGFVKRDLPVRLPKQDATLQGLPAALKSTIKASARALNRTGFSVRESGTTLICVLKCGSSLFAANVGDSRAVLGQRRRDGQLAAVPLSFDHKPSDRQEILRIQRAGGCVEPSYIPGMGYQGPARVWKKRQQLGGLALSRSMGDTALACAGVVPLADVTHRVSVEKWSVSVSVSVSVSATTTALGVQTKCTNANPCDFCLQLHCVRFRR